MLLDIAWPELMLIGAIALVVIGPKDLPRAMRIAGHWMRKARTLSREFQSHVDQMIREAELDGVREEFNKVTDFSIESEFHNTIDPTGELAEGMKPPALPDYFDESPAPAAIEPVAESELEPELPGLEPPAHARPAVEAEALETGDMPAPRAAEPAIRATTE